MRLVHRVDKTSSKYHCLPLTPHELARLVKRAKANKLEPNPMPKKKEYVARNLRRRLGPETIQELVDRYDSGEDTPALAREYGVSTTGLRELLLKEGVEFRRQAITSEDADRAVELYESGLTIREVVTKIGYSLGTIRREFHRRGVPMRPSGRWNHLPPKTKSDGD